MKNAIRPHYEKLNPLKSGFIENSNFENNRDPGIALVDQFPTILLPPPSQDHHRGQIGYNIRVQTPDTGGPITKTKYNVTKKKHAWTNSGKFGHHSPRLVADYERDGKRGNLQRLNRISRHHRQGES